MLDEDGVELADIAAEKDEAIHGARAMMAEHLAAGRPINLNHRIEVADDHGKILAVIPFRELVTIIGWQRSRP